MQRCSAVKELYNVLTYTTATFGTATFGTATYIITRLRQYHVFKTKHV